MTSCRRNGIPLAAETAPLDLDAVNEQTLRLLQAGLYFLALIGVWGIWSDVLPALGILEQVSLWTQTITVDGAESIVPVTLADLHVKSVTEDFRTPPSDAGRKKT